jgi:uncharacterized protein (TIGR02444 family)
MAGVPPAGLWDFAVSVYARPDVAPACLALQDRHGFDVNIVLLCLWLAARGQALAPILPAALTVSRRWQPAIAPLRQSRRILKALADANRSDARTVADLRARVQAVELAAERLEIEDLADLADETAAAADPALADANLRAYAAALDSTGDPLGEADLVRILRAVYPAPDAGS